MQRGALLLNFFLHPSPALWYSGTADCLQALRRQLAAVRLPLGPGHKVDAVHRGSMQRPGHTGRKAVGKKYNFFPSSLQL